MHAPFRKLFRRFIRCWKQLPIALLAFTVFALGLRSKLTLYQPASPASLLTITKLSVGDRSTKAILPQRQRPIRANAPETVATSLFSLRFQSVSVDLRHDHQRIPTLAGFLLHHYHPFLFFRPPPISFSRLVFLREV